MASSWKLKNDTSEESQDSDLNIATRKTTTLKPKSSCKQSQPLSIQHGITKPIKSVYSHGWYDRHNVIGSIKNCDAKNREIDRLFKADLDIEWHANAMYYLSIIVDVRSMMELLKGDGSITNAKVCFIYQFFYFSFVDIVCV